MIILMLIGITQISKAQCGFNYSAFTAKAVGSSTWYGDTSSHPNINGGWYGQCTPLTVKVDVVGSSGTVSFAISEYCNGMEKKGVVSPVGIAEYAQQDYCGGFRYATAPGNYTVTFTPTNALLKPVSVNVTVPSPAPPPIVVAPTTGKKPIKK